MGFVKRNLELEEYLESLGADWELMPDRDYQAVLKHLDENVLTDYVAVSSDKAIAALEKNLPIDGYIFSAPRHKYFSVYESGGENKTIGYVVKGLNSINRETLNHVECVVTNLSLTFACVFNHEWRANCPEMYYEENA